MAVAAVTSAAISFGKSVIKEMFNYRGSSPRSSLAVAEPTYVDPKDVDLPVVIHIRSILSTHQNQVNDVKNVVRTHLTS